MAILEGVNLVKIYPGGKRAVESYGRIAARLACPAPDVLFVSDVAAGLDAALAELGEVTFDVCHFLSPQLPLDLEEFRHVFGRHPKSRKVQIVFSRQQTDGRGSGGNLSFNALAHPLEHSAVLAKSRP